MLRLETLYVKLSNTVIIILLIVASYLSLHSLIILTVVTLCSLTTRSGYPASIWAPSKPYGLNQTVAEECEPSWFTCFCESNINQTFTNGGGMIPEVRIAIFAEISQLMEALITFLSIF